VAEAPAAGWRWAAAGLGLVGLVVVVLVQVLGGGGDPSAVAGVLNGLGSGQTAGNSRLEKSCNDVADANDSTDCAVGAEIDSIQDY
jgi:predicted metalloprotease